MNVPRMKVTELPLPTHWPQLACRAVTVAADMAHKAMIKSRSWAANSPIERVRLRARLERAGCELAKLREVNRLISDRMTRIPAHKRPQYKPHERLAILEYRAANALNRAETARSFHVTAATISHWQKEVDSNGETSLFALSEPVNKYPDFVTYVVQRFKALCPHLGRRKVAGFLARAALHVSDRTIERKWKEPMAKPPTPDTDEPPDAGKKLIVTAKKPDSVWHIDLTKVPINGTCNVGDPNYAALQGGWPHEWHVALVEDHFSRACIGFGVFYSEPESKEITDMLDRAIAKHGKAPKYVISDKGSQFFCENYKEWCKDPKKTKERGRRKIKPRFGAIGKHGSIAVIERLNRTMKDECTRRIIVSYNREEFSKELDLYFTWYNEYRPHDTLDGRTPMEAHSRVLRPANQMPRMEPRERMPEDSRCAGVQAPVAGKPGQVATLEVAFLEGRRHLPIIRLEKTS